ncbi:MAG TPA: J domain-containing protein [Pyrinomonadaceae bacterium]|nr:J domain-containing protein [Pyrinomonadaceae bacterium]
MVNYYETLKVSPKASNAEIKSAYRRLARKFHPDKNNGSDETAAHFAKIAKAYEVLGTPKERAEYDKTLLKQQFSGKSDSVFNSDNQHAKRWRRMAYERRFNDIIDRMIADERRETIALQKAIFPTVALFLSTCIVAIFKPIFWTKSEIVGKTILLALFIIGVFHLVGRIRAAFEKYTYSEDIHDSILHESVPTEKPYRRFTAISFLIVGVFISLGIGLLIGQFLDISAAEGMSKMFSSTLSPEIVFYPPIVVLLVDLMHAFLSKFEY